jgi:transcriptional regulator with XRE-family HTH domain
MTIGERVKLRREELGLSVDDLANILKKSRATVYRYESNDIENMSIKILEPLAKALDTTQVYLLGIENECDPPKINETFADTFNKLDDNNKNFVLDFINRLKS